ncbi:glycosyltransferase [Clostridium aestuarii]|uniref:Glycosyltransferase n=1 Tax=Clostridium aestuarii TaxID=338193 RepID=A0ABT4D2B2_9CLOT|nr:glycosyltransferase [Clostridium aestuarii]MCY6485383.1 glycosyltransferase [Clostridium aestuarii]
MRILFFLSSSIWMHTLPEGFIDAGHEVKISGPITRNNVPKLISEFKPNLIMSMGVGPDQTQQRQLIIRRYCKSFKIPHVYWSLEDPAFTRTLSMPIIQRVQPDFVFSICPKTVDYYNKMGIKAAYMDFGFAPKIHHYIGTQNKYKSSIALVANAYPYVLKHYPNHYRHQSLKTLVIPLLKENIRIDIWGKEWEEVQKVLGGNIPKEWIHGYLPYKDANKVYSSANIIIGIQDYTTQVTQRTYEVLASEGFLLTDDTIGVRKLFNPDKDLVVSSSPQNTLNLVKYYLNNPDECKRIAKHGALSTEGNSYKDRAEYMIDVLRKEKIIKV